VFSLDLLNRIRAAEIGAIAACFPAGARVLEIGAGTGRQALEVRRLGFDVAALEIPDSNYTQDRLFPITDYDGHHIPFPDASFDVVFSSNVLEHVRDLDQLEGEIKRVLRPGGMCVHVLPTHVWRFWTTLSAFPAALQKVAAMWVKGDLRPSGGVGRFFGALGRALRALLSPLYPTRHGEVGSALSELWLFHPRRWRRHFRAAGFDIVRDEPMGLHYTGHLVLGDRRSIAQRRRMADRYGSACHLFALRVASAPISASAS
jgi:SAM-dependent methyltransferase